MNSANAFDQFRRKEKYTTGQKSNSKSSGPVNFGDHEKSIALIEELLQRHSLEHQRKEKSGEVIFELQRWPENEQHPPGKAFVKVSRSGDVTAGCQHDSCKWGFPGFYKKLEGTWPNGKNGTVFDAPTNPPPHIP